MAIIWVLDKKRRKEKKVGRKDSGNRFNWKASINKPGYEWGCMTERALGAALTEWCGRAVSLPHLPHRQADPCF